MKHKTKFVSFLSHMKVRMFYGAEVLYPFLTLFTAVGVAKVAFGIPAWVAAIVMITVIFGVGVVLFRMGVFGKDRDIQWRETPMACEILDALHRLEAQR